MSQMIHPTPNRPSVQRVGITMGVVCVLLVVGVAAILALRSPTSSTTTARNAQTPATGVYTSAHNTPQTTTIPGTTPTGIANAATPLPPGATPTPTPAGATPATPTPTSVGATPTPTLPPTLTGPVLGGTYASLVALFGQTNSVNENGANWTSVTIAGEQVALGVSFDTGLDGQSHVSSVIIEPVAIANVHWSFSTAFAVGATFVPSDSQQIANNSTGQTGELVYLSQGLAQTFDASFFTKRSGGSVKPGTFDIYCLEPNATVGVESCLISPGQQ